MNTTNKYDFGKKYQTGGIGKLLIHNFYQSLQQLTQGIEINNCLEIGCGEGYSTEKISSFLPIEVEFEASEYQADLIPVAKSRNPSLKITKENIYHIQREESSIDLIYCLEVLEHLDQPRKAIDELRRVANKNVIISVPNEPIWRILNMSRFKYWSDWGNTPGHIQHWNEITLKQEIQDRFNIIAVKKPLPWIMMLLEKK